VTVAGVTKGRWLLLALPFAAVVIVPRASMDRLAVAAASPLADAAEELEDSLPEPPPEPTPLPPTRQAAEIAALDGTAPETSDNDAPIDGTDRAKRAPAAAPSKKPPKAMGVMVSRGRVTAAAKAGIRPSGSSVGATSWRPSGMALHGVGAVGVGLRDGDVVTRVGGFRATSQGAVISAVTAALRQKLPAITGEVWRGRQRIVVTVELPDVEFEDE
jgi:hypothetical protein